MNQGTFSDYHYIHGLNGGICIGFSHKAGENWMGETRSPGLFISNDYNFGDTWFDFCSRLSKNQVLHTNYFSDYHRGRSSSIGVLYGAWHGVEPVTNPGI